VSISRIGDLERTYVSEVLDSQFSTSRGSAMTGRLEKLFAQKLDSSYAIAFTNGTATMHAALAAAGVGPGDEVIVPPLTMASTAFAVLHANATPVFADIDPLTWTIDPKSIEERITPCTKAVITVSIYGLSPDMDPIMALAERHGLLVIEDDAQCLLGRYKGRTVGSIGHVSSFSFQSSKQITSGEGGMITTNDPELADRIRRFNSPGYAAVGGSPGKGKITKDVIQDPDYARHSSIGFNYRMPELCAAVLLAQTERLEELAGWRVTCANLYQEALGDCRWLVPQTVPEGYEHVYWSYVLRLATDKTDVGWHQFRRKYMEFDGDGIYAAWRLTYLEPVFQGRVFYPSDCPVGCEHHEGGISQDYSVGLCPVAESVQPKLLQFKTNYLDMDVAKRKAEALAKTISHFGG